MRSRFIDPTKHRITNFASMADFEACAEVPPGMLTIMHGGVPIDVNNNHRGFDATVVFFNAAIAASAAESMRFPVFTGSGVSRNLAANRIFVNDPSLYVDDSLLLGWYAGNRLQPDLQDVIARIVRLITRQHGVRRTVLFGASGGGFAAIETASRLTGSIAVPVNPQTSISRYWSTAVRAYTTGAWGVDAEEYDPLSLVPACTDLVDRFSRPVDARMVYVQNTGDDAHVERHYEPFLLAARRGGNDVTPVLIDSGPGHVAPAKEVLTSVLEAAVAGVAPSIPGAVAAPGAGSRAGAEAGTAPSAAAAAAPVPGAGHKAAPVPGAGLPTP